MKQNIIKEILVRVSNASPTLFKRLQAIFFSATALVVVLIFLAPLNINLHGFEVYVNWDTVLTLFGFATLSMLPVADPNVLNKKTNGDSDDTGLVGGRPDDRKP